MKIVIDTPTVLLARIDERELYAYKKSLELTKIGTEEYQKNYVSYYKVRRDKNWLAEYFHYMQIQLDNPCITFEKILKHISSVPHKTKYGMKPTNEPSFASKMLATLNPNYPIWDSQVRKAVGIKDNQSRKVKDYIEIYNELTEKVYAFLRTDSGTNCIAEFDKAFPNFTDLNSVKKIDLYLWKMGK